MEKLFSGISFLHQGQTPGPSQALVRSQSPPATLMAPGLSGKIARSERMLLSFLTSDSEHWTCKKTIFQIINGFFTTIIVRGWGKLIANSW